MSKKNDKQEKSCLRCGKKFVANRYWQKFCSKDCQYKDWDEKHPRIGINRPEE